MNAPLILDTPNPAMIDALQHGLAETVVETAKAQTYHWNVTGMAFQALHVLFQTMYEDHFQAQDLLAERIKALGGHAHGRLSRAVELSRIAECDGDVPAQRMLESLAEDQRLLSRRFHHLAELAGAHDDPVTQDMAIARADVHDKFRWMLAAHLD